MECSTLDKNGLPKTISPTQLKEYLGCSHAKLYELVARRDFPSVKIGKRYYILYDEFIKWLEKETKKNKSY